MAYEGGFLDIGKGYKERYGFSDSEAKYVFKSKKGLDAGVVSQISEMKKEPSWMRDARLHALEVFQKKPMPTWGDTALLNSIQFGEIYYYLKPTEKTESNWEDVPEAIKNTFEKLGIPEAERKFLAGVTSQYDSQAVYHKVRDDLAKQGVIFLDMDAGLREYPDLVREYFSSIIPTADNKFAALNTAVWSGGSFIYIPKGVKVELPLQAYFRINAKNAGQFERTLIIADEGSSVHYLEGCTAPTYASDSLHSAVVELMAKPGAHIRYTTIQNWSTNVFNLVTKRAVAHKDSIVEWLDGNLGCVRQGELVYTEEGPKAIERVEVGTRVWSFDNTFQKWILRPVVAVKESGLQQVYEVGFSNGRTIHLTADHPLLSVHHDRSRPMKLGRYSLCWTPLSQLAEGSFVVFPTDLDLEGVCHRFAQPVLRDTFAGRNQYGANYAVATHSRHAVNLPEQANEDVCWMLGLWLAEGDYTVAGGVNGEPRFGRVGWSVPRKDRAHKRVIGLLNKWTPRHPPEMRKDGVYFRTNSLEFALWLKANGFSSGAREKRVPGWIFSLPRRLQLSFLAGYLDGDGCAHTSGLVVKSASPALLSDVQMLAALCGVQAGRIHTEKTTLVMNRTGGSRTYVVHRLALSRVRALRPFLSPGLRSRLQVAKWEHHSQRPSGMRATRLLSEGMGVARVVAIRPSIVAPTYDLEVAGTSSFIVNGILVHNSKLTTKFPCVYLVGEGARGEIVSCAFAGKGQHQDAGAKLFFAAPHTSGTILSKSISKDGGRATYRGLVKAYPQAKGAKVNVRCDALLLDPESRSDTYPTMEIDGDNIRVEHEATVSKIGEEQLFYLMSRGLKESDAVTLVVNGFFEAFTKELPLEYAVELNRLIQLEMEGAVG